MAGYPYAMVFDGTYIWVTQGGGNTVTKLLASTGAVVATYNTGSGPNGIAFDGTNIWINNQNPDSSAGCTPTFSTCEPGTVIKMRPSDGAVLGKYNTGRRSQWVAWDGTRVWVTNGSDNTISRF